MSSCDINDLDIIVAPNDINEIAGLMMDQYNLGVEATLDSQEEELLDNVTDKLNEMFTQENMEFNPEGFKSFVKKLYPKNSTQFGGKKKFVYLGGDKFKFGFYDFTAIMSFVSSIILLYMVYVKIDIMVSQTGQSLSNITSSALDASPNYQDIMNTIENFKKSELSFFTIVMKSIGSFCSENSIQTNFSKLIFEIITKAGLTLADKCGTNVEYVSSTGLLSHILPSSMIQYANVGLNTVTTYAAPADTLTCTINQTRLQLEDLITTNATNLSQITGLLRLSMAIVPSFLYLTKRLNDYRTSRQGSSSSSSESTQRITQRISQPYSYSTTNRGARDQRSKVTGGKKSKKHIKNKRKTRKNRRKTRKNRRN
jgi:hypothetical protein